MGRWTAFDSLSLSCVLGSFHLPSSVQEGGRGGASNNGKEKGCGGGGRGGCQNCVSARCQCPCLTRIYLYFILEREWKWKRVEEREREREKRPRRTATSSGGTLRSFGIFQRFPPFLLRIMPWLIILNVSFSLLYLQFRRGSVPHESRISFSSESKNPLLHSCIARYIFIHDGIGPPCVLKLQVCISYSVVQTLPFSLK